MAKDLLRQRFFFTRHGQTDWNFQKLCQGSKDIPLNEKGLLEAKNLASEVMDLDISCIVSSPLMRAQQTAKAIRDVHPQATFHIIPELAERCWGNLEGMSSEQMYAIEKLEEQDSLYNPGHGVEERPAFRQRVLHAVTLAQSFHNHPFIVSHGRVFFELCSILGVVPMRQIPGCRVFEIHPIFDGWKIIPLKKF